MNRKQRRKAKKLALEKGFDPNVVLKLLDAAIPTGTTGGHTPYQPFKTGDKVMLKTDVIMARREWEHTLPKYKEFVEENDGCTFTAIVKDDGLVTFKEDKRWLFWCGDLEAAPDEETADD